MSGFKSLYEDSAKVERYGAGTARASHVPTKSLAIVSASVECSIQPIRSMPMGADPALDFTHYKDMYCDTTDIQEKDIVTNLRDNKKYIVVEVNSIDSEGVLMIKLKAYKDNS